MKYLYGRVKVETCIIEADSKEAADQIFTSEAAFPKDKKLIQRYTLFWMEDGTNHPMEERDKVLKNFLDLLQNVIPKELPVIIEL